jgi:ribosomal protein S18 acetylase RimI-like enzyme
MVESWERGDYLISTDRSRLDVELIHDFISNQSYWGKGRPLEVVQRALDNSLNFGLYNTSPTIREGSAFSLSIGSASEPLLTRGLLLDSQQVGFARVVTDYSTFAWVADVFVLPEHRGRGLSKWLMEAMLSHPRLQGFRRWVLATKDAHALYARFGFIPMHRPERWMERPDPDMQESPDYWKNDSSN